MHIPTLTEARRALLELMHAQRDTMPPQFAIVSMYLDSLVPLNVENNLDNLPSMNDVVRVAQPAGRQADMSRSVSMGGSMIPPSLDDIVQAMKPAHHNGFRCSCMACVQMRGDHA